MQKNPPLSSEENMRRCINPKEDAKFYVSNGRDKVGLDVKYINAFKGRGIFTTTPFVKGDFLLEYGGELISKQTSERRRRIYHDYLKGLDEEMPQKGSETTNSPSKAEDFEGKIHLNYLLKLGIEKHVNIIPSKSVHSEIQV